MHSLLVITGLPSKRLGPLKHREIVLRNAYPSPRPLHRQDEVNLRSFVIIGQGQFGEGLHRFLVEPIVLPFLS